MIDLVVESIASETRATRRVALRSRAGGSLPSVNPGAHITLELPNGLARSYSLINCEPDADHYDILVKREDNSRGGSSYIHDTMRVGEVVRAAQPRNNFELCEEAEHSVFIAGGIGITPLWPMLRRLQRLGRSWELHYAGRRAADMAFYSKLETLDSPHVNLYVSRESGGRRLSVPDLIASVAPSAHLYCCGPSAMISEFERVCTGRPADRVHREHFSAPAGDLHQPVGGSFTIVLARSGRSLEVPPNKSMLEVLSAAGVQIEHFCNEGLCGTCEVGVIEGIPDHRDGILSLSEKQQNKTVFVCCSRAVSSSITLDL